MLSPVSVIPRFGTRYLEQSISALPAVRLVSMEEGRPRAATVTRLPVTLPPQIQLQEHQRPLPPNDPRWFESGRWFAYNLPRGAGTNACVFVPEAGNFTRAAGFIFDMPRRPSDPLNLQPAGIFGRFTPGRANPEEPSQFYNGLFMPLIRVFEDPKISEELTRKLLSTPLLRRLLPPAQQEKLSVLGQLPQYQDLFLKIHEEAHNYEQELRGRP